MKYPTCASRLAALFAVCATLTACGGGGDDAPETNATSATATPAAAETADSAGTAPAAETPSVAALAVTSSAYIGNCGLANFVSDTINLVNAFRAQPRTCGTTTYPAAPALTWNDKLAQAAYGHSLDMATNNYFSHTSRDGRTFAQRISATGYQWRSAGENIAAGYSTTAAVMAGWQKSPGHCANLMNKSFVHIGLSCSKGTATSTYPTYWTMDLAKPY